MKGKEGRKTPEPEFKNPRVAALFHKWRHVWLMAMERRRKLQDALDRLNEVRYSYIVFALVVLNKVISVYSLKMPCHITLLLIICFSGIQV